MIEEKVKTLLFDIDGTICPQCEGDYDKLEPYPKAIEVINRLYDEGNRIVFYTARFMGRNKGDVIETHKEGYDFTLEQLRGWGIKFHELYMGKPRSDVIVDDKSIFFKEDWDKIHELCANERISQR